MSHQFTLLKKLRFAPLFWTQFLGAFNDNVYKNALIILLVFNAASFTKISPDTIVNLAGALFIIPFLLFSATFGQIADKYEKSQIIRLVKLLEMSITVIIGLAFYLNSLSLLLIALFLFGTHSTLFGPVKYSILPQHLKSQELIGGNGLVESGTYIAILAGTILGGVLISVPHYGKAIVTGTIFIIAFLGWLLSRKIPKAPSKAQIKINWNIFTSTWECLKFPQQSRGVVLAVLGISWFWFYGAFMFYQAPYYTEKYLGGNEHVATLVIACFSIGIGIGSLLCEKLSRRNIEIGLVPIGAIGLSVFTADLYFLQPTVVHVKNLDVLTVLSQTHYLKILTRLVLLGIFSGLYTVPLYAYIQDRSPLQHRARVIAATNILNALFMVLVAVFVITLIHLGFTIPELFLIVALLNACITIYIFRKAPEFIVRLCIWFIVNVMYRLTITGLDNLPAKGAVIYACNHVSFVDVLVLTAVSKRPIRFVMDHRLFNAPILKQLSVLYKAIPIAPAKESVEVKEQAFIAIKAALAKGEVVGIFPEGWITRDGSLAPFRKGIEEIINTSPVPVVPMALRGMWGSFFSRKHGGRAMSTFPRRFWSQISLHIGTPISPEAFTTEKLQQVVEELLQAE